MKTVEITIYTFAELSEESQEKAIQEHRDINLYEEWYECTYEDAKQIGLKITGFDLYRGISAQGELNLSACEVAQNIFNEHGESTETYKCAESFMEEWQPIFNAYMDESSEKYESSEAEEDMIYLESEFLKDLLHCYASLLSAEYEYRLSDEAVIEAIEVNEYDFYADGTRY